MAASLAALSRESRDILHLLGELGLTDERVARRCGVDRTTVVGWRSGKLTMPADLPRIVYQLCETDAQRRRVARFLGDLYGLAVDLPAPVSSRDLVTEAMGCGIAAGEAQAVVQRVLADGVVDDDEVPLVERAADVLEDQTRKLRVAARQARDSAPRALRVAARGGRR